MCPRKSTVRRKAMTLLLLFFCNYYIWLDYIIILMCVTFNTVFLKTLYYYIYKDATYILLLKFSYINH